MRGSSMNSPTMESTSAHQPDDQQDGRPWCRARRPAARRPAARAAFWAGPVVLSRRVSTHLDDDVGRLRRPVAAQHAADRRGRAGGPEVADPGRRRSPTGRARGPVVAGGGGRAHAARSGLAAVRRRIAGSNPRGASRSAAVRCRRRGAVMPGSVDRPAVRGSGWSTSTRQSSTAVATGGRSGGGARDLVDRDLDRDRLVGGGGRVPEGPSSGSRGPGGGVAVGRRAGDGRCRGRRRPRRALAALGGRRAGGAGAACWTTRSAPGRRPPAQVAATGRADRATGQARGRRRSWPEELLARTAWAGLSATTRRCCSAALTDAAVSVEPDVLSERARTTGMASATTAMAAATASHRPTAGRRRRSASGPRPGRPAVVRSESGPGPSGRVDVGAVDGRGQCGSIWASTADGRGGDRFGQRDLTPRAAAPARRAGRIVEAGAVGRRGARPLVDRRARPRSTGPRSGRADRGRLRRRRASSDRSASGSRGSGSSRRWRGLGHGAFRSTSTGGGLVPVGRGGRGDRPGRAPAPGDAGADRAGGDVEHLGDLGVVEAEHVAEHDRRPELGGQAWPARRRWSAGRSTVCRGAGAAGRVVGLGGEPARRGRRWPGPVGAPGAELVQAGVGGDPVGPGREARPGRRSGRARGRWRSGRPGRRRGRRRRCRSCAGRWRRRGRSGGAAARRAPAVAGLGRLDEVAVVDHAADRPVLNR